MGCVFSRGKPEQRGDTLGVVLKDVRLVPGSTPRVKLVLLGDSGVGKSCLLLRYVLGQYEPDTVVSLTADFMSHTTRMASGETVQFDIWDTAGQERFRSLMPLYYRDAAAAAIVYDITCASSFTRARNWTSELRSNASGDIVIALVGNKSDLHAERQVSVETAQAFADRNGMLFVESSAKTAANVSRIFEAVAEMVVSPQLSPVHDSDSAVAESRLRFA